MPLFSPPKVPENNLQKSLLSWKCCHICACAFTLNTHSATSSLSSSHMCCQNIDFYFLFFLGVIISLLSPRQYSQSCLVFFSVIQDPFQWLTSLFRCHVSFSNGQTQKNKVALQRAVCVVRHDWWQGMQGVSCWLLSAKEPPDGNIPAHWSCKKKRKKTDIVFFWLQCYVLGGTKHMNADNG